MKKGGQQLMEMGKRLPKTTEDLPPYRGEEHITYNPELAALAEGKEVFEEGYVYPQEIALQPPPTSPEPLRPPPMEEPSRWQEAMEFAATFEPPPEDPKQAQIDTLNAKIDSLESVMQQTIGQQQVRQQEDDLVRQQILEQAPPAFDPEGTGYDYDTAKEYGLAPGTTGRVPDTGMLLKGNQHPSFQRTLEGEAAIGNEVVQGEDGRYYTFPSGTDTTGEVPPPPPPAPAPAPVVPAPAPPPPPVDEPLYSRYTYELPPDEILGLKDIPNDKLLMAPRYEDRETMISELNAMLADKQPLPPIVFAGDEAVRLAENPKLERWIMSPNDIKLFNTGLVSLLIEELDAQRKGSE
jgi:hypothetical protein